MWDMSTIRPHGFGPEILKPASRQCLVDSRDDGRRDADDAVVEALPKKKRRLASTHNVVPVRCFWPLLDGIQVSEGVEGLLAGASTAVPLWN